MKLHFAVSIITIAAILLAPSIFSSYAHLLRPGRGNGRGGGDNQGKQRGQGRQRRYVTVHAHIMSIMELEAVAVFAISKWSSLRQ
jgi:hypothetical protein